jgi:hypothetical protein
MRILSGVLKMGEMSTLRLIILGFAAASIGSAGCAAADVPFHCAVKGAAMLKGRMTPTQICDEMKFGIEQRLKIKMRNDARFGQVERARSNWMKVDVTLQWPGEATALVTRRQAGRMRTLPPIGVSVSDKRMDAQSMKTLAREVGAALAR